MNILSFGEGEDSAVSWICEPRSQAPGQCPGLGDDPHCWATDLTERTAGKRYLHLNGGGSDEKQGVSIPDVDLQGLHGQVAGKPALLPGSQESRTHQVLQLKARRPCAKRPQMCPEVIGIIYHLYTWRSFCSGHDD